MTHPAAQHNIIHTARSVAGIRSTAGTNHNHADHYLTDKECRELTKQLSTRGICQKEFQAIKRQVTRRGAQKMPLFQPPIRIQCNR